MRGSAKLLLYFAAVVLGGALLAPLLFWGAQAVAARGLLTFLQQYEFDTYFHRALLVCAIAFLWPLLRSLRIRSTRDLALEPNPHPARDFTAGLALAGIPLFCLALVLIFTGVFALKASTSLAPIITMLLAAVAVPLLEETLFRGLLLGILLRDFRPFRATLIISAFFAILHFLKPADHPGATTISWMAGFQAIGRSFVQFSDPILLLAGFVTLFLIGWILADARLSTRSLWLPIGMHSGWILVSGVFGKITKRELLILPWLGRNLLVGIIPVAVALASWLALRFWLENENRRTD